MPEPTVKSESGQYESISSILQIVASTHDFNTALDAIAESVVPELADFSIIHVVGSDGTAHRAAEAVGDATLGSVRHATANYQYELAAISLLQEVLESGKTLHIPNLTQAMVATALQDKDHLALAHRLSAHSIIVVPLPGHGRVLGTMCLGARGDRRPYSERDVRTAEDIGRLAGMSLETAMLFENETKARQEAQRNAYQLQSLQRLSGELIGARTPREVARCIVNEGANSLGARRAALWVARLDEHIADLIDSIGHDQDAAQPFTELRLDNGMPMPMKAALLGNKPVLIHSHEQLSEAYPEFSRAMEHSDKGYRLAAYPLRGKEGDRAVLALEFEGHGNFSEEEKAIISILADQAELAMERTDAFSRLVDREARLSSILDSAKDAIMTVDGEGKILLFNQAAEKTFKLASSDAAGSNYERFIPPDLLPKHRELAQRFMKGEQVNQRMGEPRAVTAIRSTGAVFPAECTVSRSQWNGRPAFTVILRDVSEKTTAEKRLRQQQQLSKTILENVETLVTTFDPSGNVISWNPTAKRWLGYEFSELDGRPLWETLMPDHSLTFLDAVRRAVRKKGRAHVEGKVKAKDGSRRWLSISIIALPSGDLLASASDLTERRRLERESLRLSRIEGAVRAREDILAAVSHDIRNPLTSIKLSLSVLEDICEIDTGSHYNARGRPILKVAKDNLVRMESFVQELLVKSEQEAGVPSLRLEFLNLSKILQNLVHQSQLVAEREHAELQLDIEQDVMGMWDRIRIDQIAVNLIVNAIKHGHGTPVEIRLSADDEWAHLTVRDHGPGIPEDVRKEIFNRYTKRSGNAESFGLGLWIVRTAVDALGGTINVGGDLGDGATFTVSLPRKGPGSGGLA